MMKFICELIIMSISGTVMYGFSVLLRGRKYAAMRYAMLAAAAEESQTDDRPSYSFENTAADNTEEQESAPQPQTFVLPESAYIFNPDISKGDEVRSDNFYGRRIYMKRFTAALSAIALISSLFTPVYASEGITGEEIRELLYKSSIANSENRDEILSYDYSALENDDISSIKKLTELGDITKSFETFKIPPPSADYNTYYDYKEGDIFDYFELGSEIRSDDYHIEIPGRPHEYFSVMLYGERRDYSMHEMNCIPNEDLSFDLDRLAEVINSAGLTEISDIKLCHMNGYFYYIKADSGEFEVSEREYTNPFRDNETLEAWTVYPLGRYFEFETDRILDGDKAFDDMVQKLRSVKIPEEFDIKGDEVRETNYFEEYQMQTNPFTDTEGISAKAASLLYDMGVVNGSGEGKFDPDQSVTFEQINIMLNRLMKNDADYTEGFSGEVGLAEAASIIALRLRGDWEGQLSLENMLFIYPWIINGIESIDASVPVSRGNFAVMLCNALDRNMYTYGVDYNGIGKYGRGGPKTDICLIDYVNGRKLNGMYAASKQAGEEWIERYKRWYFTTCGDIIYEYYGAYDPQFAEELERYGWKRKNQ